MAVRGVLLLCIFGYACAGVTEKPEAAAAVEVKCDTGLAHYIELGCKPIYSKVNEKCVERYDCPFVKQFEDPKKCYYKNKEYNLRQKIDESVNDHKCSAECSCRSNYGENKDWSTFVCAQVECPENFGPPEPSKAACIRQYKMDSCCSVNEICDAAEIKALATCNWDSKDYKEGQLFYPDNTCLKCICSKEYDGTLNDSWCQRINCGIELYSADSIRSKCAPVYLQSRDCCPIDWKCLDEDDKIEQTATTKSTNPDMKCQYGNETMDIGDTVKGKDECVSCVCSVPPMITCTRSLNC